MNGWILLAQYVEYSRSVDNIPRSYVAENIGLLIVFVLALSLLQLVLWLVSLIHAIRNPTLTENQRLIWVIVIILLQGLGSLIYLVMGRRGDRVVGTD